MGAETATFPAWSRITGAATRAAVFIGLWGGMQAMPALAATVSETFGPGAVSCQRIEAGKFDCLLTSLRMSMSGSNVVTFSLATLPASERTLFQEWCSTAADDCTVQVQGAREVQESSRLSVVTSIAWTRPRAPRDQVSARAAAR